MYCCEAAGTTQKQESSPMFPFLVLAAGTLLFRAASTAGFAPLNGWAPSLRAGLSLMFLFAASAHWGKRRADLIAMVPAFFAHPDYMVTLTGILEIIGAVGLLFRQTAPAAAICLAALLVAIFPANVRAAREHLKIGKVQATPLPLRALLQFVFMGALIVAGFPHAFGLSAP
jgi:uncharacterized membrane protein